MGVEPAHEAIVGSAHQLLGIHRVDVVVDGVREHLAEEEHLAEGPFPRSRLQSGPAAEKEKNDRQRTEQEHETAAAHGHFGSTKRRYEATRTAPVRQPEGATFSPIRLSAASATRTDRPAFLRPAARNRGTVPAATPTPRPCRAPGRAG